MECPKCRSARVEKFPPNQISPRPGYRCRNCGAKLRDPGMGFVYLAVLALGSALGGFHLYFTLWYEHDEPKPLQGLWLAGLGSVCAGYSLAQLMRPKPRRASEREPGKTDTQ